MLDQLSILGEDEPIEQLPLIGEEENEHEAYRTKPRTKVL